MKVSRTLMSSLALRLTLLLVLASPSLTVAAAEQPPGQTSSSVTSASFVPSALPIPVGPPRVAFLDSAPGNVWASSIPGELDGQAAGLVQGGLQIQTATSSNWSNTVTSLPTARAGAQTVLDPNGDIFVIGGRDQNYQPSNVVEAYSPSQGIWYCSTNDYAAGCIDSATGKYRWTLPPLPTARTNMGVAALLSNQLFFLIGGQDGSNNFVNTVEVYDVANNSWYCSTGDPGCDAAHQLFNPMPTPGAFTASTVGPDGAIYVFGGEMLDPIRGGTTITNQVEAWDPKTGLWFCSVGDPYCPGSFQTLPPLPTARAGMGAVQGSTGLMYVIGGASTLNPFTVTTIVEAYDVYNRTWYCSWDCNPTFVPAHLPQARADVAITLGPDGQIYAIGGDQGTTTYPDVNAYDPGTSASDPNANAWHAVDPLPFPRAAAAAITTGGKLYVLGGMTDSTNTGTVVGEVDVYTPPPPPVPATADAWQKSYPSTYLPLAQDWLTAPARYHGQPTNTVFGNYTYQHTDLSMPGFGPPVQVARTYNSAFPRLGVFGYGWSATYGMSLVATSTQVAVTRDDGRIDTYTRQGATLQAPPGSVDTLAQNGDGTYTLRTRQHLTDTFSAIGQLVSVQDADGNTVTLQYDGAGHWSGIVDASGRPWSITTVPYGSVSLVTSVTDPAGQTTTYTYCASGATTCSSGDLVAVTDPAGETTSYAYDSQGYHQLLDVFDANGNRVVANVFTGGLTSSGQWYGRLIAQVDARSGVKRYFYFNGITLYVDPTGAPTWTFYDASYEPVYRLDPLGNLTGYTYSAGLVTSETDGNFNTSTYTYDVRGNLLTSTDPLGNTTHQTYDANDNLISKTDPLNDTTRWTYNTGNHPVSMTDALGETTTYTYDARGERTSATDPLLETTRFSYDAYGDQTSIIDPRNNATSFTYYRTGLVQTKTDPLNHQTTTVFDAVNRPTSVTAPDGGVTTNGYDKVGNRLSTTDPLKNTTTYAYDAANDLIGVTDALNNKTTFAYDLMGRQVSKALPDGSTWTTTYDPAGRKASETSPLCNQNSNCKTDPLTYCRQNPGDCHSTQYAYDANGNLTQQIDPAGHLTQYGYDPDNRLAAVIESPDGRTKYQTSYAYDGGGNLTTVTLPEGYPGAAQNQISYAYDRLNRISSTTNQDGQTSDTSYDQAGRLLTTTNGAGETITRGYDLAGDLLSLTAGGSTTRYTYDAAGNRATMVDALGQTTYRYDAANRVTAVSGPGGNVGYSYELDGNRASLTQPGASTSYSYDALNHLLKVQQGAASVVTSGYDVDGRNVGQTFGNGVSTALSYDVDGRLTGLITNGPSGLLQRISYTLDDVGNRTAETESANSLSATYAYDAMNRLVSATLSLSPSSPSPTPTTAPTATPTTTPTAAPTATSTPGPNNHHPSGPYAVYLPIVANGTQLGPASADLSGRPAASVPAGGLNRLASLPSTHAYAYTYDPVGNLTQKVVDGATTSYAYDPANRLTSVGGHAVTYDPAGRLTSDGVNQYSYDPYDHLTAIAGAVSASYQYDGDGNRVVETVDGTTSTHLLDTASPLPVRLADSVGNSSSRFVYGLGRALAIGPTGSLVYEHADGLGNVSLRTDSSGNQLDASAYAPTGERLAGAGPFGFTGEPYTGDGGRVYLRARDYSPTLDRFLTTDPHPADPKNPSTFNPYLYAGDNPVNRTDHSGAFALFDPFGSNSFMVGGGSFDLQSAPYMFGGNSGYAPIGGNPSIGGFGGGDPYFGLGSILGGGNFYQNMAGLESVVPVYANALGSVGPVASANNGNPLAPIFDLTGSSGNAYSLIGATINVEGLVGAWNRTAPNPLEEAQLAELETYNAQKNDQAELANYLSHATGGDSDVNNTLAVINDAMRGAPGTSLVAGASEGIAAGTVPLAAAPSGGW